MDHKTQQTVNEVWANSGDFIRTIYVEAAPNPQKGIEAEEFKKAVRENMNEIIREELGDAYQIPRY